MSHLKIVPDDSPLQLKCRRPRLSEHGWEIPGEPSEGEIVATGARPKREITVVSFPVPDPQANGTRLPRPESDSSPWIVITVHKESRLLQYESHYRPQAASEPELASVVKAATHPVVPFEIQEQAGALLSQLRGMERRSAKANNAPDAIAVAFENYRQRQQQDIFAELDDLKESHLSL